jgi:hypothetical protein
MKTETTTAENTFHKYYPNVFAAKCTEQHEKGSIIFLTTKYGKDVECEIYNYLGQTRDGSHLYSITRTDGFNSQARAEAKAEKLNVYAENAEKRSNAYYEASKEGRDFLALGEPIKIGHHSERRHRKLIERNWERMGKSVAESDKAKEYERRAEYWKERASKIDLSMPDSLEFFEFELEKARKKHQYLKDNPDARSHSMSLQYANKAVKDLEDKVRMAIKLWGDEDDVKQMEAERKQEAETKTSKSKKKQDIIQKHNGFFAFNNEQFREGYDNLREKGIVEEGDKVCHVGHGLYIPKKNVEQFLIDYRK